MEVSALAKKSLIPLVFVCSLVWFVVHLWGRQQRAFVENVVENLQKILRNLQESLLLRLERGWKFCGNFAEIARTNFYLKGPFPDDPSELLSVARDLSPKGKEKRIQ